MTQTAAAEEFLDAVDADDDCGLDALRGRADRDRALTSQPWCLWAAGAEVSHNWSDVTEFRETPDPCPIRPGNLSQKPEESLKTREL
jgi:hypothetical protein